MKHLFTNFVSSIGLLLILFAVPLTLNADNTVPPVLRPTGLALVDDTIYLSEAARHRVLFRKDDQQDFEVLAEGSPLLEPAGLTVDDKYLYVADPAAHNIFKIDRTSRAVNPILQPGAPVSPSAVVLQAIYDFGEQKLSRRPGLLFLDRDSKYVLRLDLSNESQAPVIFPTAAGEKVFSDPSAIGGSDRDVLVSDQGSRTLFESSGAQHWLDVRDTDPDRGFSSATGYFFPDFSNPVSAQPMSDVIYVVDDHRIFAFLRGRNRLVPLMYRERPLVDPQQIAVNPARNSLVISDITERGVTTWPLLVPITVEVEAGGDISTPLAALYDYLWKDGVLQTTPITLPYKSPLGEQCLTLACVIEKGRSLQPKTNSQIEQTLCSINPPLCRKDKLTRLNLGQTVHIPDVPFETYLSVASVTANGKSSVEDLLEHQIPNAALRKSVDQRYIKALNQSVLAHYHSVPKKGTILNLPVQRIRYYLAARKDELLSANSKLGQLIRAFPELSIRPFAVSLSEAGQTPNQQNQEIPLHTSEEIKKANETMLQSIDFRPEAASKYGRANDVPILVVETKADCKHPAFFVNGNSDEHAFDTTGCTTPEATSESIVIDWSENESRHGTCVSSIIGAKAALYGPTLAAGANLRLSASGTVDTSTISRMYSEVLRYFIVNISSVVSDVGAASSWTTLLKNPSSKFAVFVVAAGNDNALLSAKNQYPAILADTFPNVISVGALDKTGLWVWQDSKTNQGSNSGFAVEVLAPGAEVPCATEVLEGKALYTIAPGTSFATPLVSAAAALLLEKSLTPPEVKARLLATAVPIERQRSGEPLARFGRLSIARALLDVNSSYFDYPQDGSLHLDHANTPTQDTEIKYQRNDDALQKWLPLPLSDILSLDLMPGDDGKKNLYRVVRFSTDSPGRIISMERVFLQGCFPTVQKGTAEKFLVIFGSACGLTGDMPSDHWISNPKTFIAPRAGPDKFQ